MQLVKRAAQSFTQAIGAGLSLSDFDRVLDAMYGGQPSYTGKLVSQDNSLAVSTVWACVQVLSGDIATIPFIPYRYEKGGRYPARDHYLWPILLQEANLELSAFRFKQIMQTWLCLYGNAYAEIQISGRGQVIGLWPWRPDRVRVSRAGGAAGPLQYTYRMKDNTIIGPVPAERMLHLRGLGTDGVMGLSPIEVHRQTVGYAMAIQEHGARLFSNGARPFGILQYPGKLGPKAEESLKNSWAARHEGLSNAHRVAILEEGMTYKEVGLSMVDAQYIQAMGMTGEDVARIYNMPQHKVGILSHSTNNNIEHQGLDYVLGTLNPWCTNWHQEIERSLLSTREAQDICVRPNYRSRLRGDHAAMATFISQMWGRGIMSADEIREEFLDMNPLPDGLGKDVYVPVNVAPVGDNTGNTEQSQQMKKLTPKTPPPKNPKSEAELPNGLAH
jgi:HK97 family phage portal protein